MNALNICFSFSSLYVLIGLLCTHVELCEGEEQEPDEPEPIPELNDFEEAYTLFEYAKTTYNPLAYLPTISTTNKEIAEYLLLKGKWYFSLLEPKLFWYFSYKVFWNATFENW